MHNMKPNYQQYIRSNEWKAKRKQFAKSHAHDNCCYACGCTGKFDLHHRTYKRLGNETIGIDLIYLCRSCHYKVHSLITVSNPLFTAAKKLRKQNIRNGLYEQPKTVEQEPVGNDFIPKFITRKRAS